LHSLLATQRRLKLRIAGGLYAVLKTHALRMERGYGAVVLLDSVEVGVGRGEQAPAGDALGWGEDLIENRRRLE